MDHTSVGGSDDEGARERERWRPGYGRAGSSNGG